MLSKSSILKGVQCVKHLWLYRNRPEWQDPVSESQQAIFARGHRVGELAQELFPEGFHATAVTGKPDDGSIQRTRDRIEAGEGVIYEATFSFDGVLVAVDILVKTVLGWHIYEVKSSTKVREEHYLDAAVQWWVLENCGLDLSDIFITHIDNNYVRQGEIDVQALFKSESVKDKVKQLLPGIPQYVSDFKQLIISPDEPAIDIGTYCMDPYPCSFIGHCWAHIPEDSVFDVAGLRKERKFKLYHTGILKMADIPSAYRLSSAQRLQVDSLKNQRGHINRATIRASLDELRYPLYFLDFEGLFDLAVPIYNNSRPYQQIPFQYSLHIQETLGGPVKHFEFLARSKGDPREPFIRDLLRNIGDTGHIIVFNQGYESTRLNELAWDFPHYEKPLKKMLDRIWDLMVIFQKKWYYLPEMKGSYSIKNVLPALVHDLNYDVLAIRDGSMASEAFYKMVIGAKTDQPYKNLRQELFLYCELDTMAMVRILEKLYEVAEI